MKPGASMLLLLLKNPWDCSFLHMYLVKVAFVFGILDFGFGVLGCRV